MNNFLQVENRPLHPFCLYLGSVPLVFLIRLRTADMSVCAHSRPPGSEGISDGKLASPSGMLPT